MTSLSRVDVRTAGCLVVFGLCLFASLAFAQDKSDYAEWIDSGKEALGRQAWDNAVKSFEVGRQTSQSDQNVKREADFNFYLGLTYQQQAEKLSGTEQDNWLDTATDYYLTTLDLNPGSGSTLNNLGRLYAERGDIRTARTYYEAAIKLQDGRQGYYALNYAKQLNKFGLWQEAAATYGLAVKEKPDIPEAYRALSQLYEERDTPVLIDALWNAVDRGYVNTAQKWATSTLEVDNPSLRDILFIITVVALARQHYDPHKFSDTSYANRISGFRNDSKIGRGVEELLQLHDIRQWTPDNYIWWRSDKEMRAHPNSITRAQAFTTLIRSLASKLRSDNPKELEIVEDYLELAIEFEPDRVNPGAFLDLAEIYYETGRMTELEKLANTYEARLFRGKGVEYRRGDWLKIFDFHRALGFIYGRLENWGNERTVTSAIFQLEHAREAASQIVADESGRIVELEPELIDLLATAYEATAESNKAIEVRIDSAERYFDAQMFDAAKQILEPARGKSKQELSPGFLNRYRNLRFEIEHLPDANDSRGVEIDLAGVNNPDVVTSSINELRAGSKRCEPDISDHIREVTRDGLLSGSDFKSAYKAAGKRINPCEMAELREALNGLVIGGPEFKVAADALPIANELVYLANLKPKTRRAIANSDKTLAGTKLPAKVRDVVVKAKLNGASAYDMKKVNKKGDPIYAGGSAGKRYLALNLKTHTMSFEYTQITPEALERDLNDTAMHLGVDRFEFVESDGETIRVARYKYIRGGTGSIEHIGQAFHPVTASPEQLRALGYPADLNIEHVSRARSAQGNNWASNCAVMSDGSIHCLPAIRRHPKTGNDLFLTTPSLARGHQLLWNGHILAQQGRITYIGTSGRIADRAGRGKEIFLNPIPLLQAWEFKLAPDLKLVSEHASTEHLVDGERAIIFGP